MWKVEKRIEGLHGPDTSTLYNWLFDASLLALALGK
jgi:hypothetical protein